MAPGMREELLAFVSDRGTLLEPDAIEFLLTQRDPVERIEAFLESCLETPFVVTLDDVMRAGEIARNAAAQIATRAAPAPPTSLAAAFIPASPTPYFSAMPPPVATSPDPGQPQSPTQMWPATPSAGPPAVAVRNPSRIPREYTPSYVPPPYGYPPVRFQCPYCAWVEAKYDAGHFTCTRCGRTA